MLLHLLRSCEKSNVLKVHKMITKGYRTLQGQIYNIYDLPVPVLLGPLTQTEIKCFCLLVCLFVCLL